MVAHLDRAQRPLRYAIIGAGMAGLLAAIKLRMRGETGFVIFEKNPDVGGTWYENRYPGLSCDVPAHSYTYSFAPNPDWSRHFAPGPEIHGYFQRVTDQYDLRANIRFSCEVKACRFAEGEWQLELADGSTYAADAVIAATGVLHHPNIPEIPGLHEFAGPWFHSARWPDALDPSDKRIGVIGGGSTGVQIVSALVGNSAGVVQFSRTPQWILSGPDTGYSEEERAAFRADPKRIEAIRNDPDYLAFTQLFTTAIIDADSAEIAEIDAMVRQNLENSVKDPVLRQKLTPNYRAACKRLVMSTDYYERIQSPKATFETTPIARLTADGAELRDGRFHALDAIVLATGFHTDRFVRPMRVTGSNGVRLDDLWSTRPVAYLAVMVPDLPNFFFLNGPTGPVGNFSLIDIAERQWTYIDQLLDLLRNRDCRTVAPKREALDRYETDRIAAARRTIWASGCTSWYLDAEGVPASWPWSYQRFLDEMSAPRLEDYQCL